MKSRSTQSNLAVPLGVALLTILTFAVALRNQFVNLDDLNNLVLNPWYRGFSLLRIRWALTTTLLGVYQPLAWLLFGLEFEMFQMAPWGYHLVSMALHAANAVALYYLILSILRVSHAEKGAPENHRAAAMLAAALFAVHPLRTQVAVWASCQPYLPAALFYVVAVLCYLRNRQTARVRWFLLSLGCYVVALGFKAIAISLPALLLILDFVLFERRDRLRAIIEKAPFAMVAAVFIWIAIDAKPIVPLAAEGASLRIGRICYAVLFYIGKIVAPIHLSPFYPLPKLGPMVRTVLLSSTIAVVVITVVLVRGRRSRPALLGCWLAFLAMLAPNLGVVRVLNEQIGSDRYTYLPSMVAALAGAVLISRVSSTSNAGRRAIRIGSAVVILVLAGLSVRQSMVWHDSITLWTHALNQGAGAEAYAGLAMEYHNRGEFDRAIELYEEALRSDPNHREAHIHLGMALGMKQRFAEAAEQFSETLRVSPGYPQAHYFLGVALAGMQRFDEAIIQYQTAILNDPGHIAARLDLGRLLWSRGKLQDAIVLFREAAAIDPLSADTHYALGNALLAHGDRSQALAEFVAAVELDPTRAEFHMSVGTVLAQQRRVAEATGEFRKAVELNPQLSDAHYDLGLILARQNHTEEAKQHLSEAVRLKPDNERAKKCLDDVLNGRVP